MSPRDAYRSILDRCLDERRDPLDDPELCALLERHPELLDEFARTREDLRQLAQAVGPEHLGSARSRQQHRWRRAATIGAAAGVAASLAAWALLATSEPHSEPRPPRILSADIVEIAPRLHASTTVTVREPLLRTERIVFETYERRSLTR